jgi:hypothetical protein
MIDRKYTKSIFERYAKVNLVEGKDHVGDRESHDCEMKPQEFGPCPVTDAVAGISHIVKLHFDETALLKIEFLNEVPYVAVLFR